MPVDSIPTSVTFCSVNQSASISSCPVIVVNVRVSERRVPPGPGRRTVATTVSRCTSMPAHRSINTSIPAPLPRRRQGPPGVGNLSIKKLRCALEAAGQGASGSPRHTFLRARGTKKHRRRDRTTAPILIRSRVPAPAGMITFFAKSRSMRSVAFSLRSSSSSARSGSDRSLSGTPPDSLAFFTHLPNVISWTPILFATSAMDRPESRTRLTAWSLYSWVKFRRVATRLPPLRSAAVYDRVSTRSGTVHYAHCLPYFKRLETSAVRSSEELRGYDGPQPLERASATDPLLLTLFLAALQAGHPRSTDTNGREPEGFAMWERTIARGLRVSAARAFLHPAMRRPNLTVRTRTLVTKVLFSGRRAVGVRCEDRSGRLLDVRAGQVVLSGGAFNSPQLLQLSGVGNGPELAALGIPVVHELPAVGQHLQDHLVAKVQHRCTEPITMDVLRDKRRWPAIAIRWLLTRGGPAATNLYEAGAFLRTGPHVDYPDLMLGFAPAAMRFDPNAPDRGYQMIMAGMRAEARGSVTITSADPRQPPALRFNYLATDADRRVLVGARPTPPAPPAAPALPGSQGGGGHPRCPPPM